MTFDEYIGNFFTIVQCYRVWHMIHLYIKKKTKKHKDTTISLYDLPEIIVEVIYYNSIKSNFG